MTRSKDTKEEIINEWLTTPWELRVGLSQGYFKTLSILMGGAFTGNYCFKIENIFRSLAFMFILLACVLLVKIVVVAVCDYPSYYPRVSSLITEYELSGNALVYIVSYPMYVIGLLLTAAIPQYLLLILLKRKVNLVQFLGNFNYWNYPIIFELIPIYGETVCDLTRILVITIYLGKCYGTRFFLSALLAIDFQVSYELLNLMAHGLISS